MIGFIPGFPYMGMLPPALEVPRKLRPALSVPAGSVAPGRSADRHLSFFHSGRVAGNWPNNTQTF